MRGKVASRRGATGRCALLWVLLALASLASATTFAQTRGVVPITDPAGKQVAMYRNSYALVVGVSEYRYWPDLPGVHEDLQQVRKLLEAQGFRVTVRENLGDRALRRAFEDFINTHGFGEDDRLLFYFAGHGHTLETSYGAKMGYIVPADAPLPAQDLNGFRAAALDMEQFQVYARRIQSKHALFLFDSCFSGSLFNLSRSVPEHISYKTALPVRQFITSGSANEKVPDRSIFRAQLEEGLADRYADRNGDRYITGIELGEFLKEKVALYSRGAQHPQSGTILDPKLDKGDFVFALRSGAPPPPPVRFLGNVQVNVNVPADVYIGEEKVGQAQPGRPVNRTGVPAGRAEVRVQAQGYAPQTRVVEVRRGQWQQLVFDLAPLAEVARLTVRSNVSGDTVYIDGEARGPSGPTAHELAPGEHVVRVEKPGLEPWERRLVLGSGDSETLRAELAPEPADATLAAPEMVRLKGGCFEMGSPEQEAGRDNDERQHRVCVGAFAIGKYEVTNAQYRKFKPGHDSGTYEGRSLNADDQPVVRVSWEEAMAYAAWLSRETGQRYRLPTEAEWEYAARAGTQTARYWGDDPKAACAYANVADRTAKAAYSGLTIHECEDGYVATAPVGVKQPNRYGLHDVLGNVWEWTCSAYRQDYDGSEERCASKGDGSARRVFRGGSWVNQPRHVRSANRNWFRPDYRHYYVGFRLAQDL